MNRIIALSLVTAVGLSACGGDKEAAGGKMAKKETAVEHALKHTKKNYVCPMHPQIIRDKPGSCPLCGMDLVEKKVEKKKPAGERKIKYWVAPMDPNFRRKGPGKSPMGMDLVPVYEDEGDEDGVVKISPAVENNLGVRTAGVEVGKLWRKINTVGYINYDENRISHVHMRTRGWVQKLLVKSEGERVSKGQLLFQLYSPDLVNAQEEYLQALRSRNTRLVRASKDRLVSLGISKRQIAMLDKSRRVDQLVNVYAGQDGIVSSLKVREGMFVTPMMKVMTLADLSSVWVLAEVFESQSDWVKVGQSADVTLSYVPGKTWEGKVEYIYPSLSRKTRTLRVRLRFDNPGEKLKPNMYAKIAIYGGARSNVVHIPVEALIRTGESQRVIVALGKGRFKAQEVTAGFETGGYVEILKGLRVGQRVVTSGQFLIDSEASQKASIARMSGASKKSGSMKMDHGTMKKDMGPVKGTGTVKIIKGAEVINMFHGPIKRLAWPSMTMDFRTVKGVSLKGLKPGDKVEFELKEVDGRQRISNIRVVR